MAAVAAYGANPHATPAMARTTESAYRPLCGAANPHSRANGPVCATSDSRFGPNEASLSFIIILPRTKRASRPALRAEGRSAGSGSGSLALRSGERLRTRSFDGASRLPDVLGAFPIHDCLVMAFRAKEGKVLEHCISSDLGARLAPTHGTAHPALQVNGAFHDGPPRA